MATTSFQNDPKVAEIASAFSLDAVDFAARNFGIALDWSESSIPTVERMLGQLHDEMAHSKPPDDTIWKVAKMFGSYVGEVLRRHHGGDWGIVRMGDQSFPGLQQVGGALCWPWGKARNRLINGPEDDVSIYYSVLAKQVG